MLASTGASLSGTPFTLCDCTFCRLSMSCKGSHRQNRTTTCSPRLLTNKTYPLLTRFPSASATKTCETSSHVLSKSWVYITRHIWKQRNPKSPRVQRQARLPELLLCNLCRKQPSPLPFQLYSVPVFISVMYILHVWNKSYHAWSNILLVQWRRFWASFCVDGSNEVFNGPRAAPRRLQPRGRHLCLATDISEMPIVVITLSRDHHSPVTYLGRAENVQGARLAFYGARIK